jgi:methanogenic corrinoid protein MtbC1
MRFTRVSPFSVPMCPNRKDGLNAQVVIGSIQGDVHDIGKNLVKMMFDVAGWEVHDLGRDVPLEKFVEEQMRTDSEVVAMSAMMTTTMLGMKKVIKMIKEKNPNVAIMLGGAPVTKDVANLFRRRRVCRVGRERRIRGHQNDRPAAGDAAKG